MCVCALVCLNVWMRVALETGLKKKDSENEGELNLLSISEQKKLNRHVYNWNHFVKKARSDKERCRLLTWLHSTRFNSAQLDLTLASSFGNTCELCDWSSHFSVNVVDILKWCLRAIHTHTSMLCRLYTYKRQKGKNLRKSHNKCCCSVWAALHLNFQSVVAGDERRWRTKEQKRRAQLPNFNSLSLANHTLVELTKLMISARKISKISWKWIGAWTKSKHNKSIH